MKRLLAGLGISLLFIIATLCHFTIIPAVVYYCIMNNSLTNPFSDAMNKLERWTSPRAIAQKKLKRQSTINNSSK